MLVLVIVTVVIGIIVIICCLLLRVNNGSSAYLETVQLQQFQGLLLSLIKMLRRSDTVGLLFHIVVRVVQQSTQGFSRADGLRQSSERIVF